LAALAFVVAPSSALAKHAAVQARAAQASAAQADVGWGGFGNTPDENRHSPLTLINQSNVSNLGRLFTVDFKQLDPTIRLGEQSFPVEQNGTLYMTTNDGNVWALDATTGAVKWRWTPNDVAVFSDFGIVANRGVALCDGHVFVLTLDMNIVQLNQATGALQQEVPISQAVPGATVGYGYSETSAPICYHHLLILGAAGSEYGVRGFVEAYHTNNLTPAWPNPFWTIPPAGTEWRRLDPLAGGGVIWTPTTVDPTTNTLYFGTGSATPLYFPSVRPGPNPRSDAVIAVNLKTGRMDWWQQQMSYNEWSYDTSQPPLVYSAKVGGKTQRIVSVGTMEGLWFAYNAQTGRPIYQQVQVLDHTEHPALQPGKPVVVFPSSIGGFNYSPASFDPGTNYVLNAAAETASVETQAALTPAQKKADFTLGDVFLGLSNGNFGAYLPGYHDYGSLSAIDVTRGTVVWKDKTPQPERGGITTTASGLGIAGGGDGTLRVFDVKTGQILWTFQTGHQIAAGASVYSVAGQEYVAITVGGTPTSSNGGTATQLQVFGLGGSSKQSQPPTIPASAASVRQPQAQPETATAHTQRSHKGHPRVRSVGHTRIAAVAPAVVQPWQANSSNVQTVTARVLWNNTPVVGAHVVVGLYPVPRATDKTGSFAYDLDDTVAGRHVIRVSSLAHATINGKRLTAGQKKSINRATGGFTSAFGISGLHARVRKNGSVLVTGRATDSAHNGPPGVHLLTYVLSGRVTDVQGNPVKGAIVVTRTLDRQYWTRSNPTNAQGYYSSFFPASDQSSADPVPISVGVALGNISYGGALGTNINFARLQSSVLNIQLGNGTSYTISPPDPYVSSIQAGLTVGVTIGDKVVKPLSARWPKRNGDFSLVLPSSVRGHTVSFFENQLQVPSRFAASPGGAMDMKSYKGFIGPTVPRNLAPLAIPRH
jgi:glucose dehydrogenase